MGLMTLSDAIMLVGFLACFFLLVSIKKRFQNPLPMDKALALNATFISRLFNSIRNLGALAFIIYVAVLTYTAQDNLHHNAYIFADYAELTLLYSANVLVAVILYRSFIISLPQGILVQLHNPSLWGFLTKTNSIDLHLNLKRGFSTKETYKSAVATITQLPRFQIEMHTYLSLDGLMLMLLKQNRIKTLPQPTVQKNSILRNLILTWNRRKLINHQEETTLESLTMTRVTHKWIIPKKVL